MCTKSMNCKKWKCSLFLLEPIKKFMKPSRVLIRISLQEIWLSAGNCWCGGVNYSMMHKWYGGVLAGSLCALLLMRCGLMNQPILMDSLPTLRPFNGSVSLKLGDAENRETDDPVVSAYLELTRPILQVLQTWTHLKHVSNYTKGIPNAVESIREGGFVWGRLMVSFEKKLVGDTNGSFVDRRKDDQCPYDVQRMNCTELGDDAYRLQIPCGLVKGSSVTIVGIPGGDFWIDLTGEPVRWKPKSHVLLNYNVRFRGDNTTKDPVIVQNTWSETDHWGEEERCPLPSASSNKKVDGLSQCNEMIGKNENQNFVAKESKDHSLWLSMAQKGSTKDPYFPLKQGYLSVMTLRTAQEGFQMTVDGNHITAFAYRENMEPWLVHELRISGQFKLISMVASGLPTSDDSQHAVDLEALKSAPLVQHKSLNLFIGVFSMVNNFKRRMAIRRTWMQYPEVRKGSVAVRFFVSLHKSQEVNEKLWGEVQTYGDIQLLLSLDYYSLLIWKTLAICIFGTKVVSAKYVMKTDDDAFVRVNGLLTSLERTNMKKGLYYGLISNSSRPQRYNDSKWFVSDEVGTWYPYPRHLLPFGTLNLGFLEWSLDIFPPWAHGPGYVVSNDVATAIYKKHKKGQLKMFKLEDVGMGIWISELMKEGLNVRYVNETNICTLQCKDGYIVAHYQTPRQMVCLWHMLQQGKGATCCSQR